MYFINVVDKYNYVYIVLFCSTWVNVLCYFPPLLQKSVRGQRSGSRAFVAWRHFSRVGEGCCSSWVLRSVSIIRYEDLICGSILKLNLWSEHYLWDREASVCNSILVLLCQRPRVPPKKDLFFLLCYPSFCQSRCLSICSFFFFKWQRDLILEWSSSFGPGVSDRTWGAGEGGRDGG